MIVEQKHMMLVGWMCASEKAVAYLMDVRNYLNKEYIFQFEELSYNPDTYTIDGIEKVLNGTFMYKKSIKDYYSNSEFEDITFSEAIMDAANSSGASPYYLAARIRQEIGINGSDSIYGTYGLTFEQLKKSFEIINLTMNAVSHSKTKEETKTNFKKIYK